MKQKNFHFILYSFSQNALFVAAEEAAKHSIHNTELRPAPEDVKSEAKKLEISEGYKEEISPIAETNSKIIDTDYGKYTE